MILTGFDVQVVYFTEIRKEKNLFHSFRCFLVIAVFHCLQRNLRQLLLTCMLFNVKILLDRLTCQMTFTSLTFAY